MPTMISTTIPMMIQRLRLPEPESPVSAPGVVVIDVLLHAEPIPTPS
jgi:hypothetical protein